MPAPWVGYGGLPSVGSTQLLDHVAATMRRISRRRSSSSTRRRRRNGSGVGCRRAFVDDRIRRRSSPILQRRRRRGRADGERRENLIGYLTRESSLGDIAPTHGSPPRDPGVGAARATSSARRPQPRRPAPTPTTPTAPTADRRPGVIAHRNSLAVVNADQFQLLATKITPSCYRLGLHLMGYWFWELEHVPTPGTGAQHDGRQCGWDCTRFVANAFRAVVDTRSARAVPVAPPIVPAHDRASFPHASAAVEPFSVFAVVFDHFSITKRGEARGRSRGVRRAFAEVPGPGGEVDEHVEHGGPSTAPWSPRPATAPTSCSGTSPGSRRSHGVHPQHGRVGGAASQRRARVAPRRGDVATAPR